MITILVYNYKCVIKKSTQTLLSQKPFSYEEEYYYYFFLFEKFNWNLMTLM